MIFSTIANPWMPWVLSFAIIGGAFLLWIGFSRKIDRLVGGIRQATAQVQEADGQINFKRRFPIIFKAVSDNAVVGDVWRAYAATIEPAPGDNSILGYSRRPRESFNESLATMSGLNLRFYQAVPNLLVGAGLLFTFLGLAGALHFASAGVAAADVGQAQLALESLLATATFKFMTSIAGLASSIIFSWREKSKLATFEQALAQLCTALEARMVPVTTESLLTVALAEMKQQSKDLSRLGRQSIALLPEALEAEARQSVQQAVAKLHPAIDLAGKQLVQLDRIIGDEIETSLAHRRTLESVPELEQEVLLLRAELAKQQRERTASLNQAASQPAARSEKAASGGGWLNRLVGGGATKNAEASSSSLKSKPEQDGDPREDRP